MLTRKVTDSATSKPNRFYPDAPHIIKEPNKLLAKLKPYKSTGPYNIEAKLLKVAATELASAAYSKNPWTKDLEKAFVSPIFKRGNRATAVNYRPNSLTCYICKTLEHIIHSQMMKRLCHHKILVDLKHGFRRKRSCESHLIHTINDISKRLNLFQEHSDGWDFSKAFDKVSRKCIPLKLDHYSIRGKMLA